MKFLLIILFSFFVSCSSVLKRDYKKNEGYYKGKIVRDIKPKGIKRPGASFDLILHATEKGMFGSYRRKTSSLETWIINDHTFSFSDGMGVNTFQRVNNLPELPKAFKNTELKLPLDPKAHYYRFVSCFKIGKPNTPCVKGVELPPAKMHDAIFAFHLDGEALFFEAFFQFKKGEKRDRYLRLEAIKTKKKRS